MTFFLIQKKYQLNKKKTIKTKCPKYHMDWETGFIKYFLKLNQDYYPESSGISIVIHAPTAFKVIWALVKKVIHPNTQKKVKILGKKYEKVLTKIIDLDQIPRDYGGKLGYDIGDSPSTIYDLWINQKKPPLPEKQLLYRDVQSSVVMEVPEVCDKELLRSCNDFSISDVQVEKSLQLSRVGVSRRGFVEFDRSDNRETIDNDNDTDSFLSDIEKKDKAVDGDIRIVEDLEQLRKEDSVRIYSNLNSSLANEATKDICDRGREDRLQIRQEKKINEEFVIEDVVEKRKEEVGLQMKREKELNKGTIFEDVCVIRNEQEEHDEGGMKKRKDFFTSNCARTEKYTEIMNQKEAQRRALSRQKKLLDLKRAEMVRCAKMAESTRIRAAVERAKQESEILALAEAERLRREIEERERRRAQVEREQVELRRQEKEAKLREVEELARMEAEAERIRRENLAAVRQTEEAWQKREEEAMREREREEKARRAEEHALAEARRLKDAHAIKQAREKARRIMEAVKAKHEKQYRIAEVAKAKADEERAKLERLHTINYARARRERESAEVVARERLREVQIKQATLEQEEEHLQRAKADQELKKLRLFRREMVDKSRIEWSQKNELIGSSARKFYYDSGNSSYVVHDSKHSMKLPKIYSSVLPENEVSFTRSLRGISSKIFDVGVDEGKGSGDEVSYGSRRYDSKNVCVWKRGGNISVQPHDNFCLHVVIPSNQKLVQLAPPCVGLGQTRFVRHITYEFILSIKQVGFSAAVDGVELGGGYSTVVPPFLGDVVLGSFAATMLKKSRRLELRWENEFSRTVAEISYNIKVFAGLRGSNERVVDDLSNTLPIWGRKNYAHIHEGNLILTSNKVSGVRSCMQDAGCLFQ